MRLPPHHHSIGTPVNWFTIFQWPPRTATGSLSHPILLPHWILIAMLLGGVIQGIYCIYKKIHVWIFAGMYQCDEAGSFISYGCVFLYRYAALLFDFGGAPIIYI